MVRKGGSLGALACRQTLAVFGILPAIMLERHPAAPIVAFAFAWVIAGLTACTPSSHTVEPYKGDAQAAAELEGRALAFCGAFDLPSRPFVTDGCSMWPDGGWGQCCVEHDIPYWCGGSREQRLEADRRLRECVADRSGSLMAWMMFLGVRVGGYPSLPFYWRWGFGHPWPEGYRASE